MDLDMIKIRKKQEQDLKRESGAYLPSTDLN